MSAERVGRLDPWVGCVLGVETGVLRVLTDGGELRASFAGSMLAEIARDPARYPVAGDWVVLRRWTDGRVTVEGRWAAPTATARVIPLRRR